MAIEILNEKEDKFFDSKFKIFVIAGVFWFHRKAHRIFKKSGIPISTRNKLFLEAVANACRNRTQNRIKRLWNFPAFIVNRMFSSVIYLLSVDNAYNTLFHEILKEYNKKLDEAKMSK